jgi:hypothetical protein
MARLYGSACFQHSEHFSSSDATLNIEDAHMGMPTLITDLKAKAGQ